MAYLFMRKSGFESHASVHLHSLCLSACIHTSTYTVRLTLYINTLRYWYHTCRSQYVCVFAQFPRLQPGKQAVLESHCNADKLDTWPLDAPIGYTESQEVLRVTVTALTGTSTGRWPHCVGRLPLLGQEAGTLQLTLERQNELILDTDLTNFILQWTSVE